MSNQPVGHFQTRVRHISGELRPRLPATSLVFPFIVGVFFPYLVVLPLGTDLQPTALIFGTVICAVYGFRMWIPKPLLALGIPALGALALLAFSNVDLNSFRSIANYVSFFVISAATFLVARHPLIHHPRTLDVVNLIWLLVGVIQSIYNPLFLSGLLSNFRTTPTRGVVSLAAEPSFYGIACVVFLLLYYLQGRETSVGGSLCILQIALLAKSPTAAIILAAACVVYVVLRFNFKVMILGAFFVVVMLIAQEADLLADSRLVILTNWALEDPKGLLLRDHSASARFYHVVYSFQGAFSHGLIPRGFSAWADYLDSQLANNSYRYLGYFMETPDRIMSAIGASFFELGFMAVAIPAAVVGGVRRHFGTLQSPRAIVYCVAILLVMLNSVPLGFPLYGFLVGYCYAHPAPKPTVASLRRGDRVAPLVGDQST